MALNDIIVPRENAQGQFAEIVLPDATTSARGLMSAASQSKLDGIAAGAEVNVNADWNASSGDAQILNKPASFTPSAHAASHAAGTKAEFNGDVSGMTENVFIRANTAGTAGNSITLTFDGFDDIDTVLGAWNSANPSNQVTLVLGDGSQIPDNGEEITLSGGVAGGSDPFKNINQDLGTQDEVEFAKLTLIAPANGEVIRIDGVGVSGNDVGFSVHNTTGNQANSFYFNQASQYVGIGVGNGEGYIQASVPLALPSIKNSLVIRDGDGGQLATINANTNLTANRQYELPNASGTIALTSDIPTAFAASAITSGTLDIARIPTGTGSTQVALGNHAHGNITSDGKVGSTAGLPLVTTTAGAVTTLALGTANQVLRVNSGATGVEFGAGFDAAAPPAIGSTTANTGAFTTLTASTSLTLGTSGILSGGTNLIEQRNTTNGQTFRIYNTVSGAADANHERGFMRWSSNVLQIGTEAAGTGTNRNLEFHAGGAVRFTVNAAGGVTLAGGAAFAWGGGATRIIGATFPSGLLQFQTGSTDRLTIDANGIIGFGGTTSSFPALKRSSTTLQVRLADDSAFAPFECGALTLNGNLTASTRDIVTDTTTGTKIGTGTTQKLGFWNATPAVQPAAVADATDAASTQARLNDLLARLRTIGIIAT